MRERRKRILIDATGVVSAPTGLGKYCYYLLKSLVQQKQYRFSVLLQTNLPNGHPVLRLRKSVEHLVPVSVPVIGFQRELEILRISRFINQFDLYHCLSSYLPGFGIKIPKVLTVHDLKYLLYPKFFNNRLKSSYYKWIIRRGIKIATHIIAVSESTRRDIADIGISPERVTVIYEAPTVSPREYGQDLPAQIRTRGFLLYVGENRPHKNISRMIDAYALLSQRLGSNTPEFVFAGAKFGIYDRQRHERGLVFLGPVSEAVLVALYRQALALVYPSLYEGFGLPLVEAMALGTPVITSNCSSMPEVTGNAALLVDPYRTEEITAAIERVIQSSRLRARMKRMGFKRASNFSWAKAARQVCELYRQILT